MKVKKNETILNTLLNFFPDGTTRFVVAILVWWFQVRIDTFFKIIAQTAFVYAWSL